MDGGLDAQTIRLEGNIGSRSVGGSGIINRYAAPECIGGCNEESFSAQPSSVKALLPTPGAAVLACELAGLPWSTINLSKLKAHATGKGNARMPEILEPGGSMEGQCVKKTLEQCDEPLAGHSDRGDNS